MGGWIGGQAEYVMVPYADFNLLKFPDKEKAKKKIKDLALLSDIFPTGFFVFCCFHFSSPFPLLLWSLFRVVIPNPLFLNRLPRSRYSGSRTRNHSLRGRRRASGSRVRCVVSPSWRCRGYCGRSQP